MVVGADGAHSLVRQALLGRRRDRRAIAIRGYAPVTDAVRGRQVIRFGDRTQTSYAWAFDRGDGLANVGYGELLPSDRSGARPPSRRLLLDQLEQLLPGAASTGSDWRGHHLPLSSWRWDQPDGPVLLVGDAAGLVNPMTGEGIYYAVATGIAAGRTAARAVALGRPEAAGARHRHVVRTLLGAHLRHTWAASRLAQSPRIVDAGIRAAGRDRHVFDALVEIGLGGRPHRLPPGGRADPQPRPAPSTPTRKDTRMRILAARSALPEHSYPQAEITEAFTSVISERSLDHALLRRFHRNSGVERRHTVLPLAEYATLGDFGHANDLFIEHAVELGAQALVDALKAADLTPSDVDLIVTATVTGPRGAVARRPDRRRSSGCARTYAGCRWSAWAAWPAPPGSPASTTTCSGTPTTPPSWWRSSCAR